MSPTFTILVPTHDHATLLPHSVGSALAQTEDDLEVVVIGDGVGDDTRDVVADLARDDPRVRFVDRPKSPRTGETYRHEVLRDGASTFVTYLSDDDLLFPNHLAVTREALSALDVVHAFDLFVDERGQLRHQLVDLGEPELRRRQADGASQVSLTGLGHSLATYRKLPHGWRTTPKGFYTDEYMVAQFIDDPRRMVASLPVPTCVKFPGSLRQNRPIGAREEEMARWSKDIADPARRLEILEPVVGWLRSEATSASVRSELLSHQLHHQAERLMAESREMLERQQRRDDEETARLRGELDAVTRQLADQAAAAEWNRRQVELMRATVTWRLRDRVVRFARRERPH